MGSYYTDVEVSEKLGKSIMAVWNMANRGELPSKRVDGKRVYPKYAIDSMLTARQATPDRSAKLSRKNKGSSPSTTPKLRGLAKATDVDRNKYFTLEQVAFALQRTQRDIDRMVQRGEIQAETIDGRNWVSMEEAERIISKREPQRQMKIRKRLPQPHKISEQPPPKMALPSFW